MSRTPTPLYREIACKVQALRDCEKYNRTEWAGKHREAIEGLVKDFLPSGSGIDNGVEICLEASTPDKLVFHFGYHHMAESGMYDGWTSHTLTVRPSLVSGIDLRISGKDRNQVKEMLYEQFSHVLRSKVWWVDGSDRYYSEMYETPPTAEQLAAQSS